MQSEVVVYKYLGFLDGSVVKNPPAKVGDAGSIPGSGRSLEEGMSPLQYSCLENSMDRGTWRATFHGVTRVRHNLEQLNNNIGTYVAV